MVVAKRSSPCSVCMCVVVVLWLLCMYALKEQRVDGCVTGAAPQFVTTDVWKRRPTLSCFGQRWKSGEGGVPFLFPGVALSFKAE